MSYPAIEPDASQGGPQTDKFWFHCDDVDGPLPVKEVDTRETAEGTKQTVIRLECPVHGTHRRKFDWSHPEDE